MIGVCGQTLSVMAACERVGGCIIRIIILIFLPDCALSRKCGGLCEKSGGTQTGY